MKDKIAEIEKRLCICGPEYIDRGLTSPYCMVHEFAADILSLFKNFQVEVECPECKLTAARNLPYSSLSCNTCQGTRKITRPATPEELKKGGILREVKGGKGMKNKHLFVILFLIIGCLLIQDVKIILGIFFFLWADNMSKHVKK